MSSWRDGILKHFQPRFSRLTLVADPDELLTEERTLSAIRERGFDLIPFDDSIAFRYAYESQYRSVWDHGGTTDLVVVLRSAEQELKSLPFDLLKAGRQLTFALHHIFPKLNYPVLANLDRVHLDAVYAAYSKHDPGQLTELQTKDFVLTHCFGVVPKLVRSPVELLKALLSLHSRRIRLPDLLAEHLVERVRTEANLMEWPLAEIVGDPDRLTRFLQTEWALFLDGGASATAGCRVPFGHDEVRPYIDTLFFDGVLAPVEHADWESLPAWVHVGVVHDPKADAARRYEGLKRTFEASIPPPDAPHHAWQRAAERWAELVVLRWECDDRLDSDARASWTDLHIRVEDAFAEWMLARSGSLHNLPPHHAPVMVHQVPAFMAAERTRRGLDRIALVVLDGMALDQWVVLRRTLRGLDTTWRFRDSCAFAWVPTLTSISRQSIFAGGPPLYFPESLGTTSRERSRWLTFWEDHGVQREAVELVSNISGPTDPNLEAALAKPRLSVLGVIWNKIDDIMHGMEMQTAGMHNHVALWGSQRHLHELLMLLHREGFAVYLTADHGNVAAQGIGSPREGVLVETRGSRVRVYDHPEFRDEVADRFPDAIAWPGHGLPPGKHVLLARRLSAFIKEGSVLVSHGGVALEEVLVPFVAITREAT